MTEPTSRPCRTGRFLALSAAAIAVAVGAGWAVGKFRSAAGPHPLAVRELAKVQGLLRDAGFTDLGGLAPPALTVVDADGNEVKLSDLKGRTVVIHFWGIDCPHCLKEMPSIREIEVRMMNRAFTALHICTDAADARQAQQVISRAAPGLRAFADTSGIGPARFEVQALPAIWLIGPDGKAIGRASGARDWTAPALAQLIESSLPK